jgi:hypothetical protein
LDDNQDQNLLKITQIYLSYGASRELVGQNKTRSPHQAETQVGGLISWIEITDGALQESLGVI